MELRESIIKQALSAMDWPALQTHLDEVGLTEDVLSETLGHATRHTEWICKYPNKGSQAKRSAFLAAFESYAEEKLGPELSGSIRELQNLLSDIEYGYHSILTALDATEVGKKPAPIRAWATFLRACDEYHLIVGQQKAAFAAADRIDGVHGVRLTDENGNEFSFEAAVEKLAEAVRLTLLMEASKNKWFNDVGEVVLPATPAISPEVAFQVGSTQLLAVMWGHWNHLERRRRFLGGTLTREEGEAIPTDWREKVSTAISYRPDDSSAIEAYDFLANHRLKQRLGQTFLEMHAQVGDTDHIVGIDAGAASAPEQFVSLTEVHTLWALKETLGYSVLGDPDDSSGLTLQHWVRGYAVLHHIASEQHERATAGIDYAILISEADLVGKLEACGLTDGSAERFVALVCLHRGARDMFDCPVVRVAGGRLAIFSVSLATLSLPLAVLSNISTRGKAIGRKGSAFESSIREKLARYGFEPKFFKFHRNGEEYEIDAIIVFDTHIFLFECKNHSLSGGEPSEAYHFALGLGGKAEQVNRLAAALRNHSDVVAAHLGAEHVGKPIIPCVLHSLPYAMSGDVDGVYFTDASALGRFFEQRYLNIVVPHSIGGERVMHLTPLRDTWGAEKPTVEAFLKQLEEPLQLELSIKHLEAKRFDFAVGPRDLVTTFGYTLKRMDEVSVSAAVGADPIEVQRRVSEGARLAAEARKRLPKKG